MCEQLFQLHIMFKEDSGLPLDVESTQVAFNFMFIVLNWDLSLVIKRTRIKWKIMSTPDLANLASQLTHTLDDSTKRKTTKILSLLLQQMKTAKKNQGLPWWHSG